MTALALTSSAPLAPTAVPQSPAPQWLAIGDVVRLLGINEGTARRRCVREWKPQCKAEQRKDHRGRTVWFIHVSAHPDLLRSHVITHAGDAPVESALRALMRFPEAKREQAQKRVMALMRFREWRREHATNADFDKFRALIQDELKISVSRSQVYAWNEMCPATDDFNELTLALIDRRGASGGSACSQKAWATFEQYYLSLNQPSIAKCWRMVDAVAKSEGWTWPSLSRVKELVADRVTPERACFHREGEKEWERRFKAPIQQNPDAFKVGQCWESDHSRLDQFIRHWSGNTWVARRPWLTVWRDWRSRRVMGWHIDILPSGDTIRAALLNALSDEAIGPPEFAWLDHGKDYEQALNVGLTKEEIREIKEQGGYWYETAKGKGLLGMLGIEGRFALPYNHNGKARVEAFFNYVHLDFDRAEGHAWCGSKPGDRDVDSLRALTRDAKSLPDIEDLRAEFREWVHAYNCRSRHAITDLADRDTGELLSPLEFYERYIETRRVLRDRESLQLLEARWSRPLSVSKHGISLSIGGRVVRYGDESPELRHLIGSGAKVFVSHDPNNTASIRVYDAAMKLICVARENDSHGRLEQDGPSVEARKRAWQIRREQKAQARHRPDVGAMLLPDAELADREQRKLDVQKTKRRLAERGIDAKDAPNVRLVATPVDGQAEAVKQAERRVAVGAESMSTPRIASRMDLASLMAQSDSPAPSSSPRSRSFDLASMQAGGEPIARHRPASVNLAAMESGEIEKSPAKYSIAALLAEGGDA